MKLIIPKRWSRPMKKSKFPVSDEYNEIQIQYQKLWKKIQEQFMEQDMEIKITSSQIMGKSRSS